MNLSLVFVNMHCPWKQGPFLKEQLLSTSDHITIFVGDSNYASKNQIDDQPVLLDCFANPKYGFIIPRQKDGVNEVTWTNVNIRKNCMSSGDIDWLYDHNQENIMKSKFLELKQYDVFDIIAVQFSWSYPRFNFAYTNVDCLYEDFKC